MGKKPPRNLTDEEKTLWKLATKGVKNKKSAKESAMDDFFPKAQNIKITSRVNKNFFSETIIAKAQPGKSAVKELIANHRNALDAGNFEKLKKGKMKIDARIDLHGMRVDAAHIAVRNFIEMSHAAAKRCLLVITGKGAKGGGKIRNELSHWLNDADLRRLILSYTQASDKDGGSGAFYIYLRK